jgi:acyl-CoA dehydrogenase
MPVFKAPVDDTLFILNDVLGYERYMNLPGFADASPDIVEAILQEGARISEEVMLPLNQGPDPGRGLPRSTSTARTSRRPSTCRRWSRAPGPAP